MMPVHKTTSTAVVATLIGKVATAQPCKTTAMVSAMVIFNIVIPFVFMSRLVGRPKVISARNPIVVLRARH
jgi:hypothetical protein